MKALRWLAVVLSLSSATPLAGQDSFQRIVLARWRDSLAAVTDDIALQRLEQRYLAAVIQDAMNPLVHLRLGWIALRRGELAGPESFDQAAAEFRVVSDLRPDWPAGWYGMGVAELRVAEAEARRPVESQSRLRLDATLRAEAAFRTAVDRDSTILNQILLLAGNWYGVEGEIRAGIILNLLRSLPVTVYPECTLLRARLEIAVASAAAGAACYRNLAAGSQDGTLLYLAARAMLMAGDPAGSGLWLHALGQADASLVGRYRDDLKLLLSDSEKQRWDQMKPDQRVRWTEQYFLRRDAENLLPSGGRLIQHYRRLREAVDQFAVSSHSAALVLLRGDLLPVMDARASRWVRDGMPQRRIDHAMPGLPPSESWAYLTDDGMRVFHFLGFVPGSPMQPAEDLSSLLGGAGDDDDIDATSLRSPDAEPLRLSRAVLGGVYRDLLDTNLSRVEWRRQAQLEAGLARKSLAWAGEDHADQLPLHKGAAGVFLPLDPEHDGTLRLYALLPGEGAGFQVRATAISQNETLILLDSLLPTNGLIQLPLELPPGTWRLRAVVLKDDARLAMISSTATLHRRGSRPGGSSLMLTPMGQGISLSDSAGESFWLGTTERVTQRDSLSAAMLLTDGWISGNARVEMRLSRLRTGGGVVGVLSRLLKGRAVTLRENAETIRLTGMEQWLHTRIALDGLAPGRYRMQIKVFSEPGQTVSRTGEFEVFP